MKKPNCKCVICGEAIYRSPAELKNIKDGATCSLKCRGIKLKNRKEKRERPNVSCEVCGEKFYLAPWRLKKLKSPPVCSKGCENVRRHNSNIRQPLTKEHKRKVAESVARSQSGLHSKLKGTLGELRVAELLTAKGYAVFKEIGDFSSTDLIIETSDKLVRIQCKSAHPKNGTIGLILTHSTRKNGESVRTRYSQDEFDYFALINLENLDVYMVPVEHTLNMQSYLTLRLKKPKSGAKNLVWASKYHIDKSF